MKKYFTSLEVQNDQFVATVFDANTNQELYKTKPYRSQSNAIKDANNFLTNQKPTKQSLEESSEINTLINTAVHTPVLDAPPRRCCGR
jgi:hypothetical protein